MRVSLPTYRRSDLTQQHETGLVGETMPVGEGLRGKCRNAARCRDGTRENAAT